MCVIISQSQDVTECPKKRKKKAEVLRVFIPAVDLSKLVSGLWMTGFGMC